MARVLDCENRPVAQRWQPQIGLGTALTVEERGDSRGLQPQTHGLEAVTVEQQADSRGVCPMAAALRIPEPVSGYVRMKSGYEKEMALKDSATDAVPGAVMGELAGFTIPRAHQKIVPEV